MKFWKQLDRKTIYDSSWLRVTVDKVELPDGKIIENFELMHYPHDAVGIIATDKDGKFLLVRAYRYIRETFDWEIPGGVVELNEKHIDAARRELVEETGYTACIYTPLIDFYPHKATCDQTFYIWHAEDLEKAGDFQKVEVSEVGLFTEEEIWKMIEEGQINDGVSLTALQHFFLLKKHQR